MPDALTLDCRQAYSDAERRELWQQQGGTVLEHFAEQCGVRLLDILDEYGENREKWADILRWRGEIGGLEDGAASLAFVNAEGS